MEREFKVAIGWKIFYCTIAAIIAGIALWLFTFRYLRDDLVILFPIFILTYGVVLIAAKAFRKSVMISADGVKQVNAFNTKEMATADIKGCRISDKVIRLEPISPSYPKIAISNYSDLDGSDDLVTWIRDNFTDLDAADLKAEQDTILHDAALGITERDREDKLANAKRVAMVYNAVGIAVGVAGFIMTLNKGANQLTIVLILLYPLAAIVIIKLSNGLIKFISDKKRSVYPSVFFGFYIPALLIFINSISAYDIFNYQRLWPVAIAIILTVGVLLYFADRSKMTEGLKGQLFLLLLLCSFYGYGATVQVNCVFDRSPPKVYHATVLSRRVVNGKSTTYHFLLSPWGPRAEAEEVTVPSSLYREVPMDGTVQIDFKAGFLNIPWFTVTDQ